MNTGADERSRTPDLLITNELLYRLSYIGLPPRNEPVRSSQKLYTISFGAPVPTFKSLTYSHSG